MTQPPTFEINQEKLSQLTIADLTGLITLTKLYPFVSDQVKGVFVKELEKKLKDIIIE
jgi:hypothetical protein